MACQTFEWWCDRGLPTRTKRNGSLLAITGFHAIVKKRMSRSPDCWDGNAAMTYCYWMPYKSDARPTGSYTIAI